MKKSLQLVMNSQILSKLKETPVVFHPQVGSGTEEQGLLGSVSEIHDLAILICPVENIFKI